MVETPPRSRTMVCVISTLLGCASESPLAVSPPPGAAPVPVVVAPPPTLQSAASAPATPPIAASTAPRVPFALRQELPLSFKRASGAVSRRLLVRGATHALVAGGGKTMLVSKVGGGEELRWPGGSAPMNLGVTTGVALSPDGKYLAVTVYDRELTVYGIPGGKPLRKVKLKPCGCKKGPADKHTTVPIAVAGSKVVFHDNCQLYEIAIGGTDPATPIGAPRCAETGWMGAGSDGRSWWLGTGLRRVWLPSPPLVGLDLLDLQTHAAKHLASALGDEPIVLPRLSSRRICFLRVAREAVPYQPYDERPKSLECVRLADGRRELVWGPAAIYGYQLALDKAGTRLVYALIHGNAKELQKTTLELRLVDFHQGSWRVLATLPYPRAHLASFVAGDRALIVGGVGATLYQLDDLSERTVLSPPAEHGGVTPLDDKSFVMGVERGPTRDLYVYQP